MCCLYLIALTVFITILTFADRMAPRVLYASLWANEKASADVEKTVTDAPASTSATKEDAQTVISSTHPTVVGKNDFEREVVSAGVVSSMLSSNLGRPILTRCPQMKKQPRSVILRKVITKAFEISRKIITARATEIGSLKTW